LFIHDTTKDIHKYNVTLFLHVLWHLLCHHQRALHLDFKLSEDGTGDSEACRSDVRLYWYVSKARLLLS